MTLQIVGGQIPCPGKPGVEAGLESNGVQVENGRIRTIGPDSPDGSGQRLDAAGCTILPGFIDVHIHGGAGVDVMDATPEAIQTLARLCARHGVTGFLPTTMTGEMGATLAAVAAVARTEQSPNAGARILGVHLEGPFISPRFPGAQDPRYILPPQVDAFHALVAAGPVAMITLAPEVAGADALIQAAVRAGVVPVMGHTDATYEAVQHAVTQGVHQATHTYNAMSGLHHRRPGTLGAILSDDRIYAQLIADTIHVHPAAMNILARCKGVARTLLITDAMRATDMPDGEYELGGLPVFLRNQECRQTDGVLAGSVLTMERALANFMAASALSLAEAWPASSLTPATTLGLSHEMGRVEVGYRADLVLVDENLEVVATLVGGQIVYLRAGEEGRLTSTGAGGAEFPNPDVA